MQGLLDDSLYFILQESPEDLDSQGRITDTESQAIITTSPTMFLHWLFTALIT